MKKILLCLEDYNEGLFVETLLKKLGMVTDSVRSEMSLPEKLLGFAPDLIICTGEGSKINGDRVAQKAKKTNSNIKMLLAFNRNQLGDEIFLSGFQADGVLETPINPRSLISTICKLLGISPEKLADKFEKLGIVAGNLTSADEVQLVSGIVAPPKKTDVEIKRLTPSDPERAKKYQALLKEVPASNQSTFSKQKIKDEVLQIRKSEAEDPDNNAINLQRQDFVKKLFKK